jgi:hypothetical protein
MVRNHNQCYRKIDFAWKSHFVKSKDGSILPYCLPFGKAGELQILRCQGIAVADYSFILDAWSLKPSDVCNIRVNCSVYAEDLKAAATKGRPNTSMDIYFRQVVRILQKESRQT